MANKEAAVRPKTGSRERPYSVSKDEAYARQLNRELNETTFEEDEEMARRIQKELEEEQAHADEELARRLHVEEHSPGMVYMPGGESGMPLENLFHMLMTQMRENNTSQTEHEEAEDESSETPAAPADALPEGATGLRHPQKAAAAGSKSPERKRRGFNAGRSLERSLRGRGRGRSASVGQGETPVTEQGPVTHPRPHLPYMQQVQGGRGQSSEESETVSGRPVFTRFRRPMFGRPMRGGGGLRLRMLESNLPDGEFDPDMVQAERSERAEDFVSIMRDPFLLMMMLMNRDPRMLVPEDIDFSDYERNATCPICRHEVKPKNSSG